MTEESTTPDLELLVRQAYDSFNRGDVEPLMGLVAPNIVLDTGDSRARTRFAAK
jgi:hypothetical protein